ncbi:DNA/RNA non-specific endonuclease [Acidovorax sp. PRC11]|uniref:DNA/RNA non-specific endonuclease n=2 Tax=Bacteria TaxID=2 RepID=UPI00288299D9|nr:DNA/RNA non-specific endonuclease [Acidovorax sp. PRC11]MDT0139621.1 DNA/RNA non-specific endonuclease [Acidovorax sp. PRC11]
MATQKRKRTKKSSSRTPSIALLHRSAGRLRRLLVAFAASAVVGVQVTSCGIPSVPGPGSGGAHPAPTRAGVFSACRQHFAGGTPPITPEAPRLRELCFDAFAVLHSGNTRTPVYVAERLNRQILQQARQQHRTDRFYADARLPRAERAELEDYRGSGYARGHMAPAGDMGTPEAMAQSFSLANMVPQDQKQNSGPWAKIEEDTRRYALRARGNVYVITGPVFEPGAKTIGSNGVAVPSHVFKLVYDAETGKSWAHWQQNAAAATPGTPITLEELERRTGMQLLPQAH